MAYFIGVSVYMLLCFLLRTVVNKLQFYIECFQCIVNRRAYQYMIAIFLMLFLMLCRFVLLHNSLCVCNCIFGYYTFS